MGGGCSLIFNSVWSFKIQLDMHCTLLSSKFFLQEAEIGHLCTFLITVSVTSYIFRDTLSVICNIKKNKSMVCRRLLSNYTTNGCPVVLLCLNQHQSINQCQCQKYNITEKQIVFIFGPR